MDSPEHLHGATDPTERDLLTQELRRREAYLAEAQRLSHTGSFGWRPDSGEIVWSDETYRIFEYNRAEKPTLNMVLQRIHPNDRALAQQVIEGVSRSTDFEHEYRLVMPSGATKYIHVRGHALPDSSGNIEIVGAVTDITERKTTEDKIRRLVESDILGIFFGNVQGVIVEANQAFLQMLQYDHQDLASGRLSWKDLTPAEWRERDLRALAEATEHGVFQTYEKEFLRKDGSRIPVLIGGALFQNANEGVVFVLDLREQKRAVEALRSSETYLAEAQRLSQTGSWAWNPASDNTYYSEECYRLLGFEPLGPPPPLATVIQRIHPDDQAFCQERVEKGVRDKLDFEFDYRIVHPDKRVRDIHCVCHPVLDRSGDLVELVGTVIDVTEHKRAEEERRRVETELQQTMDLAPLLIGVYGPNLERVYANRTALEYHGMSLDEWRQTSAVASAHPDDYELFKAYVDGVFSSGAGGELELRIRKHDGTYRWFLIHFSPLRDEQGRINRWFSTGTDIEERKQAEDRLRQENVALKRAEELTREKEMELQQILDFTPQPVGVIGPREETVYANRALLNYFGLSLTEWQSQDAQTRFHPDDLENIKWGPHGGPPDHYEARLKRYDGKYRWFLVYNNPLRDEHGQITRWLVAGTDIEDRKRAEERLREENVALREEIDKASMFEEIVGSSPALQTVLSRISKVSPSDSTVLITGETGTGKELVARAIHRRSNRASRAFVSVNCAAIPRDLIASELFGHEKGAFTGATQQRMGRFELANGGTLFLDEVGELPAETQIALLRVLQEHEFERVGGTRPIPADVRVIAATNRDLQAAISAGAFRSDLYYRLNVFPIEIPPLRERKQDIALLVEYFIDRYARKAGKKITAFEKKTLRLLESYPWPGNIRELQNVIERSIIVCETENFSVDESWLSKGTLPPTPRTIQSGAFKVEVEPRSEREIIEAALADSRGRVSGPSGAAAKLGIPPTTLDHRIKALKIDKRRFKFV
jgi:PAS domain S-box-containing protein